MPGPDQHAEIARQIRADQAARWERGERPLLESYLRERPELLEEQSLLLDLLESEFHLRRALDRKPDPEEYCARFPELAIAWRKRFAGRPPERPIGIDSPFLETTRLMTPAADLAAKEELMPAAAAGASGAGSKWPAPGRKFGRYVVGPALGHGGMGTVFKAHDTLLDIPVALKAPRLDEASGLPRQELFLTEARMLARLYHPHLCRIFDYGEIEGRPFIAMGFVDGKPLRFSSQLAPRKAADLVRTIALAVHDAHAVGVIHRDLKPGNILLTTWGEPVVVDFGLAIHCADDEMGGGGRISHEIAGTVPYMSPEQFGAADAPVDLRTDIYSLGIVLYELLTGRRPFEGKDIYSAARLIGDRAVPAEAPSRLVPGIDAALDAICLRAIEKEAGKRFQSMREFAAAIADYLSREAGAAARIDPSQFDFQFLPVGSTILGNMEHQDRLYLDVGNQIGPGVLDHHSTAEKRHSTTSCVVAHPDWVLAAPKPWRRAEATFTVVVHANPDLDSAAAIFLAGRLFAEGELPPNAAELAAYIDAVNQGSLGVSPANLFSPYAAYLVLGHRLVQRNWSSRDAPMRQLIREGLQLIGYIVENASETGQSIESIDAFGAPGLFGFSDRREVESDAERYARKLNDPMTAARHVFLRLAATDGRSTEVETLFVRNVQESSDPQRCLFFKDWARSDREWSQDGSGFVGLCVFGGGPETKRRCTISVRPNSGASLFGLAARLDQEEAAVRRQQFGVDDRLVDPATGQPILPRIGYQNADPWYDGSAHGYTIVDSPSRGTLLKVEQIEEIVLAFGDRGRADLRPLTPSRPR